MPGLESTVQIQSTTSTSPQPPTTSATPASAPSNSVETAPPPVEIAAPDTLPEEYQQFLKMIKVGKSFLVSFELLHLFRRNPQVYRYIESRSCRSGPEASRRLQPLIHESFLLSIIVGIIEAFHILWLSCTNYEICVRSLRVTAYFLFNILSPVFSERKMERNFY